MTWTARTTTHRGPVDRLAHLYHSGVNWPSVCHCTDLWRQRIVTADVFISPVHHKQTLWHGLNLNWPEWLMAADEDGGVFLGGCPSGKVTNQRWTIDSVAAGVHGSFWCQSSFSTSEPNSQQTHVRKIISIMQFSARHQLIHTVHLSRTGSWHRVF